MLRTAAKLTLLGMMVAGGTFGLYYLEKNNYTADLRRQVAQVQARNAQLEVMVQRLQTETRRAEILVTDQATDTSGNLKTTLLLVEYAKDGTTLPAKRFVIDGKTAHLDALVVKFDGQYVTQNDPLRGHSIALFTRIYSESQSPERGFPIDDPGQVPAVYQGSDPRISEFEQGMWREFWRLVNDPLYRQQVGVRVAQGEGVWGPFEPGRLYTVTLEANGGLNLTNEPLKGIYMEALKRQFTQSTPRS